MRAGSFQYAVYWFAAGVATVLLVQLIEKRFFAESAEALPAAFPIPEGESALNADAGYAEPVILKPGKPAEAVSTDPALVNLKEPQEAVGLAQKTIEGFLDASSPEERLRWIYRAEDLKDRVERYYGNHPDGSITDYQTNYLKMEASPDDGEFPLLVFFLQIGGEENEFPVAVRWAPAGMKIDWEMFVEFRDQEFGKFVRSGEAGLRVFRVIVERQTYWGEDRNQMTDYLSYRVESPDGSEVTAFVPKNSPRTEMMGKFFHWGAGPITTTMEVEKVAFQHGESHYVINNLVTDPKAADGWHIRLESVANSVTGPAGSVGR